MIHFWHCEDHRHPSHWVAQPPAWSESCPPSPWAAPATFQAFPSLSHFLGHFSPNQAQLRCPGAASLSTWALAWPRPSSASTAENHATLGQTAWEAAFELSPWASWSCFGSALGSGPCGAGNSPSREHLDWERILWAGRDWEPTGAAVDDRSCTCQQCSPPGIFFRKFGRLSERTSFYPAWLSKCFRIHWVEDHFRWCRGRKHRLVSSTAYLANGEVCPMKQKSLDPEHFNPSSLS